MDESIYHEKLQSKRTTGLFTALAVVFLSLFTWRISSVGWKFTPILFLILSLFFMFCVFNYRTLQIHISEKELALKFGVVRWRTQLKEIQGCSRDDPPLWIKYGGAGVHFALVGGVYQAFFNFLEGPRVLITYKAKRGPVQALSFSTHQPDRVLDLIGRRISE